MFETAVAEEVANWWLVNFPNDFDPAGLITTEVPYPKTPRSRCDLVLTSSSSSLGIPEWAVEVKRLQFIGNNGKNNDYNVQKMLSPYLKDRSLIHDVDRMRHDPIAPRQAVIGYAFEYSFESCDEALNRHPLHRNRIEEIRSVCSKNDAATGLIDPRLMVNAADLQLTALQWTRPAEVMRFKDLWRHPCGGSGIVFGWELKQVSPMIPILSDGGVAK
jgi:hypothetical protein